MEIGFKSQSLFLFVKKIRLIFYKHSLRLFPALTCFDGCAGRIFVERYAAPLIISAATFVLLTIPAFVSLLIMRKKKTGNER